jgi:hypothetical protein
MLSLLLCILAGTLLDLSRSPRHRHWPTAHCSSSQLPKVSSNDTKENLQHPLCLSGQQEGTSGPYRFGACSITGQAFGPPATGRLLSSSPLCVRNYNNDNNSVTVRAQDAFVPDVRRFSLPLRQNRTDFASFTQRQPPWSLDRIDQPNNSLNNAFAFPSTAPSVSVYVLDTGIRATHSEFYTVSHSGQISNVSRVQDMFGVSSIQDISSPGEDCAGHGSHVASLVGGLTFGVAKGVQLKAMRVLDCNGVASAASIVEGLTWLRDNAVQPAVALIAVGEGPIVPSLDEAVERCA